MLDNVSSQAVTLILVSTAVALLIGMGITVFFTKRTKTNSDWAIGGRKVPTIVLIFTMFATQCGGGVLVGHIGIAYSSGYAVLAYLFAGCAGLLLMILAANWFRKNEFVTIPDIFRKLYGENKFLLIVASIMAMIVPFGWICSQSVSFGKLFASLTGVNTVVLIAIFLIICVLFTLPSGFNSVVWSDFVFGVMMLILCLITAGQALSMGGGWSNIRFTSKGRTVRLQIGDGMDKVQIYINRSAEVSYMLYGFCGNNVRRIYYSYGDNDDHEDVIDKATEDFALLVKAFLKNQDLHDFTEMILTYDRDNTPTIERYLHLYDWDEDEEDENL